MIRPFTCAAFFFFRHLNAHRWFISHLQYPTHEVTGIVTGGGGGPGGGGACPNEQYEVSCKSRDLLAARLQGVAGVEAVRKWVNGSRLAAV